MRPRHILNKNARRETPLAFIVVDTETTPVSIDPVTTKHILRLGVAHYRRLPRKKKPLRDERFVFYSAGQFWEWVIGKLESKAKLWLWAHNLSFDAQVLETFATMAKEGFEPTLIIDDSPPTVLSFMRDGTTLHMLDTMNYIPLSLASIGRIFEEDKLAMPPFDAPDSDWLAYCHQDTNILLLIVGRLIQFVRDNDCGNFRDTAASLAFGSFRHKWMKTPIYIHDNERVCALERNAYYGGRTEAFYIGKIDTPVYVLDVNSMYPAVMASGEYPTKLIYHNRHPSLGELAVGLDTCLCIASVILDTSHNDYPTRIADKLIFPLGNVETTLATPELKLAMGRGEIVGVTEIAWYDSAPLFRGYVDYYYTLRKRYEGEGNKPFALFCKMLLNSLYGKFGQRRIQWERSSQIPLVNAGVWEELDATNHTLRKFRVTNGYVQERIQEDESHDSFPAVAAHVTSSARVLLNTYIEKAGYHNVYYCDTDSLFVSETGKRNLECEINEMELGKLKLERVAPSATIRGLKDYKMLDLEKIKGIRRGATAITPTRFRQEQFRSIRSALNQGSPDVQLTRIIEKQLARTYNKGVIGLSGWVTPFVLAD